MKTSWKQIGICAFHTNCTVKPIKKSPNTPMACSRRWTHEEIKCIFGHRASYITKYTVVTKGLSENTIRSYTYTFQLLFVFLKEQKISRRKRSSLKPLTEIHWSSCLLWLEVSRECSISTRNQRLSGLSSFAKYAVDKEPVVAAGFYNAVLGIPKRKR